MARELKPCGTPAAYRRHLRHGEAACQACLDAEAARSRLEGNAPFQPARHGTKSKYDAGCRCEPCTRANRVSMERWREGAAALLAVFPELVPHGTVGGYRNYGCRCRACTTAHSAAHAAYRRRRREREAAAP